MSLLSDMHKDLESVFLNENEFAERRIVGGKPISCVLYAQQQQREPGADELEVAPATYVLQCRRADIARQRVGDTLIIDGTPWMVTEFRYDYGMAVIHLTKNA